MRRSHTQLITAHWLRLQLHSAQHQAIARLGIFRLCVEHSAIQMQPSVACPRQADLPGRATGLDAEDLPIAPPLLEDARQPSGSAGLLVAPLAADGLARAQAANLAKNASQAEPWRRQAADATRSRKWRCQMRPPHPVPVALSLPDLPRSMTLHVASQSPGSG